MTTLFVAVFVDVLQRGAVQSTVGIANVVVNRLDVVPEVRPADLSYVFHRNVQGDSFDHPSI